MAIPYDIAVKLTMINGVSSVLAVIGKEMLGLEGGIAKLQKAFLGLNATSAAIGGGIAIFAGYQVISGMAKMVDHAKELSHELVQIKKLGVSPGDFEAARKAAYALHSQVAGVTSVDALKIYGASYGIFGAKDSLKIMKPLAEFTQVMGNTTHNYEKSLDDVYKMVRSGELMGKFIDDTTHVVDTGKLTKFLSLGSKVVSSTHGRVNADTWMGLAQQGGPALSQLSEDGMLTMAIAAQAMGGMRAGTALTSFYQQMVGGKMTESAADLLSHKYGLLGKYQVKKGGHIKWADGALDTDFTKLMKEDQFKAVELLQSRMESKGLDTIDKQVPELFQILGRQTTVRLVHDILRNLPQINAERERIKAGMSTEESKKVQDEEDYDQIEHNYESSKKEMLMHIGLPLMQAAIPIMKEITGLFDGFANFAKIHPNAIKTVGYAIAGLAAALIVIGGGAVVYAAWLLLPAGVIGLAIIAIAGIITTLASLDWKGVRDGLAGFTDKFSKFMSTIEQSIGDAFDGIVNQLGKFIKWLGSFLPDWMKSKANYEGDGIGGGGLKPINYGGGGVQGDAARFSGGRFNMFPGGGSEEGTGESRGERNNNRGNLKYGPFAKEMGATGQDAQGHAIFPDQASGDAAAVELLKRHYNNMSPLEMAQKYTTVAGDRSGWASLVAGAAGVGVNDKLDLSKPGMADKVFSGIRKAEGTSGRRSSSLSTAAVLANGNSVLSNAYSMIGMHERINNQDVAQYLRTGGHGMDPAKTAWCAAFVGATLEKSGIHGTNSEAAASYFGWGKAVVGAPQAGDVLVRQHHVGFATGEVDENGRWGMISGNHGDRVGHSWESPRNYQARRALPNYQKNDAPIDIHQKVMLDGEAISRNTERHLVKRATHPTSAPYHDGKRSWTPPDSGLVNI